MEKNYRCGACGFESNYVMDFYAHKCCPRLHNPDAIEPQHYQQHPSGVDCIQITEHMNFPLGNVIKYVWRAGLKGEALEDLKKARWYLDREIARIEKETEGAPNYMYGIKD